MSKKNIIVDNWPVDEASFTIASHHERIQGGDTMEEALVLLHRDVKHMMDVFVRNAETPEQAKADQELYLEKIRSEIPEYEGSIP